jgi:drug/metabolite transporter (DMT)-like permease
MDPALWGAVTATTWGTADFIARYTSRAMGTTVALTGVLIISGLGLTLLAWDDLAALSWRAQGGPLAVAGGIGITFATLLLYWGLARGPVTVVAPITACYPAFAMLIAVARGGRPGAMELLASAIVLVGVVVVARFAVEDGGEHGYSHDHVRKSAWIGLAAAAGFAVAVLVAQEAATFHGELPTLWIARWVGVACLLLVLAARRQRPHMPVRWWPFLALQGLLDSVAYVALFTPAGQPGAEMAVVVSSGFSAVTVLLARIVLREAMSWAQWAGIVAIIGGVALLSYYS